jgi:hypothetical protein
MAELKKYTSFEALKMDEKLNVANRLKDFIFSEFEEFVKQLRSEYANKKNKKTHNGKLPGR